MTYSLSSRGSKNDTHLLRDVLRVVLQSWSEMRSSEDLQAYMHAAELLVVPIWLLRILVSVVFNFLVERYKQQERAERVERAVDLAAHCTAAIGIGAAVLIDGARLHNEIYSCSSTTALYANALIAAACIVLHLSTTGLLLGLVTFAAIVMLAKGSGLALLATLAALGQGAITKGDAASAAVVMGFHCFVLSIAESVQARCGEQQTASRIMIVIATGEGARAGIVSLRRLIHELS